MNDAISPFWTKFALRSAELQIKPSQRDTDNSNSNSNKDNKVADWLGKSIRGLARRRHVKVKAYKSQNLVPVDSCWGRLGESLTTTITALYWLSLSVCVCFCVRVYRGVYAVAKSKAASSYQMIYLRARQANKQATMPTVQHGPRQFAANDSDACQIVTSAHTHKHRHTYGHNK